MDMLPTSIWDAICLRYLPADWPLDATQRCALGRALRRRSGFWEQLLLCWLLPLSLFGMAAGLSLYLLGLGLVYSVLVVLGVAGGLWMAFARHTRSRIKPNFHTVLRESGILICFRCFYWIGENVPANRACPECGARLDTTKKPGDI